MYSLTRRIRGLASALVTTALAACSGSEGPAGGTTNPTPPSTLIVSVSPDRDSIDVGQSKIFLARVTDGRGVPQTANVQWSTLDATVATVSAGTVTGVAPGTTQLVARVGISTDTALVVVRPLETVLQITPSAVTVSLGDTVAFQATLVSPHGSFAVENVEWRLSDSTLAGMIEKGVVEARAAGTLDVIAQVGGKNATASVAVFSVPVGSVTLTPTTASIGVGSTVTLTATVRDQNGRVLKNAPVTWWSQLPSVAAMDAPGRVRGVSKGASVITAQSGNVRATAWVNVTALTAATVTVALPNDTIIDGHTMQAVATMKDANGNTLTGKTIAWYSSNPAIATVNASGLVTALVSGTVNISAVCDGKVGAYKLTVVQQKATSVAIEPAAPSITKGATATMTAELQDQMGQAMTTPTVTWTSANPGVVSIANNGTITGVNYGTAKVTATVSGLSKAVDVTVQSAVVASVRVVPATLNLPVGSNQLFAAQPLDANGNVLSERPTTWVSSNTAVATVSKGGRVTAVARGTTTIRATVEGFLGTATVVVIDPLPAPVASVTVSLSSATLNIGQTASATASLFDAQGNTLTGRAIAWSSLDTTLATVSSTGVVTARAGGTVTIAATSEGETGYASLNINAPPPAPVASVVLNVATNTLNTGQTTQGNVTLYDAQGNVLTGRTIAWSTSKSNVATVSTTGLINGVGAGSASITATSGTASDTEALTVNAPPATLDRIDVSLAQNPLDVGNSTQGTAVPRDASGNVVPNVTLTWTTSDPNVATVSASGLVTAVGAGQTAISASGGGKTNFVVLTVNAPVQVVTTVSVALAASSINVGQTTQATATARDAQSAIVTGRAVTWTSMNTALATVSPSGLVTAMGAGTVQIRATVDGVNGNASLTVTSPTPPPPPPSSVPQPALPQVILNFPYPTVTGKQWLVKAGDNLQTVLNSAQRGDEIVIAAGATFTGNFILPAKTGTLANGWIIVRSDKSHLLPPVGTRVTAAHASLMPKIVSPGVSAALKTAIASSGWRLVGLELTVDPAVTQQQYGILWLGDGNGAQKTLADVATDLVVDRSYIHGQSVTNTSRCIALNSARTAIQDSYIVECHGRGFDSQAIVGWNGPGPYKIVNNTLQGAGENIMFGGGDPSIQGLIPSDIEIRRNYVYTPVSWNKVWTRKNLLETKNVRRMLVEGNVFEGSWADAQTGWGMIFKSSNQAGGCTWCASTDITIRYNVMRKVGAGINLAGREGSNPNPVGTLLSRVLIEHNVIDEVNILPYKGDARMLQILENAQDITISRNTMSTTGIQNSLMNIDKYPAGTNMYYGGNIATLGQYGIFTTGGGQGINALAAIAGLVQFPNNVMIGPSKTNYPTGTTFVSTLSAALAMASVGADMNMVNAATAGIVIP